MLTSVEISSYRGFKQYHMAGLTPVNLLGGRNNSGKTAILEAIHLLASGGHPEVLVNAASRRGELVFGPREEPGLLDVSHFFHGHDLAIGRKFTVSSKNGFAPVTVEAVALGEVEPTPALFEIGPDLRAAYAIRITGRNHASGRKPLIVSEEGALMLDPRRQRWYLSEEPRGGPPVVFITPDSMPPGSLTSMWNQVLRDKREGSVRLAMQILEPTLEDIVFQAGEYAHRQSSGRSGVLVSFSGDARRIPLGSMGDGMRRLLALSISLIHAKGGYLLVDEIDTGLHYSVMADMWKLVVETATSNDIQVFATTHSKDCFNGLAALCEREPDKMQLVSVHKIDRALTHSVPFSGEKFLRAHEGGVELR